MAKKKVEKAAPVVERTSFFDDLSPHAKQAIGAVSVAVVGVFFAASLFDVGGPVGHYTYLFLSTFFGAGAYLSPVICAFYVYTFLNPKDDAHISGSKVVGIALFFLAVLGLLEHYEAGLGGWMGLALSWPLSTLLGGILASTILCGVILISLFLFFNIGLRLRRPKTEEAFGTTDIDNLVIPEEALHPELPGTSDVTGPLFATPDKPKKPLVETAKETLRLKTKEPGEGDFIVSTFRGRYAHPRCPFSRKILVKRRQAT